MTLDRKVKNMFDFILKKKSGFDLIKKNLESQYPEMIFQSSKIKIWVYEERAQHYFKIASIYRNEWINFKHLKTLITGIKYQTDLLTADDPLFFKNNLKLIEQYMSKEKISVTIERIDSMLTKRANEKWGPTLDDLKKSSNSADL